MYLLQAEVQNVFSDGALSLHTRSLKYGKVTHDDTFVVTYPIKKSTWACILVRYNIVKMLTRRSSCIALGSLRG